MAISCWLSSQKYRSEFSLRAISVTLPSALCEYRVFWLIEGGRRLECLFPNNSQYWDKVFWGCLEWGWVVRQSKVKKSNQAFTAE